MSNPKVAAAVAALRPKLERLLQVRGESLRSEIYGTLEAARVGRGRIYIVGTRRRKVKTKKGNLNAFGKQLKAHGALGKIGSDGKVTTALKLHYASAPGDPPARRTGRLMESVKASYDLPNLTMNAGPDPEAFEDAYYPRFLEFGTSRMAARPFMRPAIEAFKRKWSDVSGSGP